MIKSIVVLVTAMSVSIFIAGSVYAMPEETCGPLGRLAVAMAEARDGGTAKAAYLNVIHAVLVNHEGAQALADTTANSVWGELRHASPSDVGDTIHAACLMSGN